VHLFGACSALGTVSHHLERHSSTMLLVRVYYTITAHVTVANRHISTEYLIMHVHQLLCFKF